jgi:hypothetical protein
MYVVAEGDCCILSAAALSATSRSLAPFVYVTNRVARIIFGKSLDLCLFFVESYPDHMTAGSGLSI